MRTAVLYFNFIRTGSEVKCQGVFFNSFYRGANSISHDSPGMLVMMLIG